MTGQADATLLVCVECGRTRTIPTGVYEAIVSSGQEWSRMPRCYGGEEYTVSGRAPGASHIQSVMRAACTACQGRRATWPGGERTPCDACGQTGVAP